MTFLMIGLFMTAWALSLQTTAAGMSTGVANFLAVVNGDYSNIAQYQNDGESHDYIQIRCVPVIVPALTGRTVLFSDYGYNGKTLNLQLSDLREDKHGNIHVTIYNFTKPKNYKTGQFKVEDLYKVKPEDLETHPSCKAMFQLRGPNMYIATWPECRHYINGKPDLYAGVVECKNMEIIVPSFAFEKRAGLPYKIVLTGNKYDIPGVPKGFINPCTRRRLRVPFKHQDC